MREKEGENTIEARRGKKKKKKLSPRQKGNSVNLNNKWKLKFQRIADP